jgi:hypothetical protein
MVMKLATRNGYAYYQRAEPSAKTIRLTNETSAEVVLSPGAAANEIASKGGVRLIDGDESQNSIHQGNGGSK